MNQLPFDVQHFTSPYLYIIDNKVFNYITSFGTIIKPTFLIHLIWVHMNMKFSLLQDIKNYIQHYPNSVNTYCLLKNVNSKDKIDRITPLLLSLIPPKIHKDNNFNKDIAELLLLAGANPNKLLVKYNKDEHNRYYHINKYNNPDNLKVGYTVLSVFFRNAVDDKFGSILYDVSKLLLKYNVNINIPRLTSDYNIMTPLISAIIDHLPYRIIALLLFNNADINIIYKNLNIFELSMGPYLNGRAKKLISMYKPVITLQHLCLLQGRIHKLDTMDNIPSYIKDNLMRNPYVIAASYKLDELENKELKILNDKQQIYSNFNRYK